MRLIAGGLSILLGFGNAVAAHAETPRAKAPNCAVTETTDVGRISLTALTFARATALVEEIRALGLPWAHRQYGCDARAYAVGVYLHEKGIESGRVFALAKPGRRIILDVDRQTFEWDNHIATIIQVKTAKGPRLFVVDLSTADGLVSLDQWTRRLSKHPGSSIGCVSVGSRFQYDPPETDEVATSYGPLKKQFAEGSLANQLEELSRR